MESKLLDIVSLLFLCGSVCATTVQNNAVAQLPQTIPVPDNTTSTTSKIAVVTVANTMSFNNSNTNSSGVTPPHEIIPPKSQDGPINVIPKGVDSHTDNATAASENKNTTKINDGETTAMPLAATTIHSEDKTGKTNESSPTTASLPSSTENSSTVKPKVEEMQKDRQFDGPSFIGGIFLALGLTGIGFVAYKFCKSRTDRNYRNL